MSHRPFLPPYLHNLQPKLWNLARPSFWGTAIFLSVVGFAIGEDRTHPDFFRSQPKQEQKSADSSLSLEDRAIAADIDNLPVLFYDFEHTDKTSTADTFANKSSRIDNKGRSEELGNTNSNLGSNSAIPFVSVAPEKNPFVLQAENLLQMKNWSGDRAIRTGKLSPSSETINQSPPLLPALTQPPQSALQTALDTVANTTSSTSTDSLGRSQPTPNLAFSPTAGSTGQASVSVTNNTNPTAVTATNQPLSNFIPATATPETKSSEQ